MPRKAIANKATSSLASIIDKQNVDYWQLQLSKKIAGEHHDPTRIYVSDRGVRRLFFRPVRKTPTSFHLLTGPLGAFEKNEIVF